MSELRQRKGEKPQESAEAGDKSKWTPSQKQEVEEKLQSLLQQMKPNPKPGTSNEAKKYKDELAQDPYNMGLIFELGKAYAEDEQWDRCCNVMLRGFKRVSELKSEEDRFDFLAVLSQASMHLEKYRQALAVINDMTDPTDPDSLRGLNIMRCQVHCSTGDMQKGLKAFNAAIEGASFQEAVKAWAGCSRALKQVNAWMVTKNSIAKLTHTEEEKKQLESIDKLCELKDEVHKIQSPSTVSPRQYLGIFVLLVILFCGLALLYVAEQRSLAKMEWRK